MRIIVTDAAFSPQQQLDALLARADGAGALASFVGLMRPTGAGADVQTLELQHYPGFTEREIERLANNLCARHALNELLVVHRVGVMCPGDAIVLVAALSAHRKEAFAAVETMMDYLKTDAPIWKREHRSDGAHWVEPTPDDHTRRQRHEGKRP